MESLQWEGSFEDSFTQHGDSMARIWWDGEYWRVEINSLDFEPITMLFRDRMSAYRWIAREFNIETSIAR